MAEKQITLHYGKEGIPLAIDENWNAEILRKSAMPVELDPYVAVGTALATPVACERVETIAEGRRSACIVLCDITRPVPNGLFLRQLVDRLRRGGISREDVILLIATGLHRPNEGAELKELIGDDWVFENCTIVNHDARDDEMHVDLGATPRGTPVKLDRRFVEAELKIVTGLVEPHFMAGYSGGRKVIAPGIAHKDTITTFHNSWFMSHPAARNCNLEGNPLHEEQLEIVKMLGEVYAVNTVLDEARRLSYINFGEVRESHRLAVEHCEKYSRIQTSRKFKTVVTTAAGYPLDKTYYQTVKGMVGAMDILDDGGTLIIASECSEGLGSKEYRESQGRLVAEGQEKFLQGIAKKDRADIDEWQTQMQLRAQGRVRIELFSTGLLGDDRLLTGVSLTESIERSIAESVARSGDPAIAIIPEGPYVIPDYQGS